MMHGSTNVKVSVINEIVIKMYKMWINYRYFYIT